MKLSVSIIARRGLLSLVAMCSYHSLNMYHLDMLRTAMPMLTGASSLM